MTTKPSHTLFTTRKFEVDGEQRTEFNKVGVAWEHLSGDGFQISLTSLPIDGKLVMLVAKENDSETTQQP